MSNDIAYTGGVACYVLGGPLFVSGLIPTDHARGDQVLQDIKDEIAEELTEGEDLDHEVTGELLAQAAQAALAMDHDAIGVAGYLLSRHLASPYVFLDIDEENEVIDNFGEVSAATFDEFRDAVLRRHGMTRDVFDACEIPRDPEFDVEVPAGANLHAPSATRH